MNGKGGLYTDGAGGIGVGCEEQASIIPLSILKLCIVGLIDVTDKLGLLFSMCLLLIKIQITVECPFPQSYAVAIPEENHLRL